MIQLRITSLTAWLVLAVLTLGGAGRGAAQPEPAPPPREKATPAELLVGRWRAERYGSVPLPKGSGIVETFTKDGQYIGTVTSPGWPDETITGTYRVIGGVVEIKSDDPKAARATSQFEILKISRTELIKSHGPENGNQVCNMIRFEKK